MRRFIMNKSKVMEGFEALEANDRMENDKLNKKAPKAPKEVKAAAEVKAPEVKVIDIAPIISSLPTDRPVTPATLDKLFNLNDGGKTVRRHLRKRFAETMGHEYKSNWSWGINDPILNDIIQYFASKYQVAK